ncbi:hypothetical protein [Streptomyces omiyaensis]|uniref:hypothetical protein n=1 Tax=Streptomyces omiyaensis TaxID=68247 RepID=UPI0036FEA51F
MRDIKTRYRYGKTNSEGRTPVHVDGAAEPAGHVRKIGRSSSPWHAVGVKETLGTSHPRKYEAAERIVRMVDADTMFAQDVAHRRARRTTPPQGWQFVSWEEVERQGHRQVRPVHRAPLVAAGETDRYPDAFAEVPVTLTRVTRLENGHVVISGREHGQHSPYVLLMDPAHAELGALIPDRAAQYEGHGRCPACEQDTALYRAGTRLACARTTAADLGVPVDHLPAPADHDSAVWWRVGDSARRTFELPDHGHAETGRIIETTTDITDRTRRARVDYGGRWAISSAVSALAPLAQEAGPLRHLGTDTAGTPLLARPRPVAPLCDPLPAGADEADAVAVPAHAVREGDLILADFRQAADGAEGAREADHFAIAYTAHPAKPCGECQECHAAAGAADRALRYVVLSTDEDGCDTWFRNEPVLIISAANLSR